MKKTAIHFSLSYIVWLIIAGTAGWIPLNATAVLWSTLIFILLYAVNSLGWYLYFKKMETTLNKHLENKK
jgi:hypothetical protein